MGWCISTEDAEVGLCGKLIYNYMKGRNDFTCLGDPEPTTKPGSFVYCTAVNNHEILPHMSPAAEGEGLSFCSMKSITAFYKTSLAAASDS